MRAVIILFAKAPQPGRVKTRLVPPLTLREASELHVAFVDDMLARLQTLPGFHVELHTDASSDAWMSAGVSRKLQISGGLELKMFHALEAALASGYDRAVIVGADAPTVPLEHVRALLGSAADVALGRADDGGFWGISARRTNPDMFSGVLWSRPDTLDQTVRAVEAAGLSTEVGPAWFDVDKPADLDRLLSSPDLPPATERWARRYRRAIAARRANS